MDFYLKVSKAKEMLSSTISPIKRKNAVFFAQDFENFSLEKKFLQPDII